MNHFKKSYIIGVSALIGVFAAGGTAYAFNQHHYLVQLNQAKQGIKSEQANIHYIQYQLSKLVDKEGFLQSVLTSCKR